MSGKALLQDIEVIRLGETTSTSDVARTLAEERHSRTPLLVTARHQFAGRGRGDHRWLSSPGDDLLMTLLWYPRRLPAASQFSLSMATALAVSRLLQPLAGGVAVKWPNDLLVAGQKIAGILIDHTLRGEHIDHTLLGIGININAVSVDPSLPAAVSLRQITGRHHDMEQLLSRLTALLKKYLRMVDEKDFASLKAEYESLLYGRGGTHTFRTASGEEIEARIAGVDDYGRLLLSTGDGHTRPYGMDEAHQLL